MMHIYHLNAININDLTHDIMYCGGLAYIWLLHVYCVENEIPT